MNAETRPLSAAELDEIYRRNIESVERDLRIMRRGRRRVSSRWMQRLVSWRRQRYAARLERDIADLEAQEKTLTHFTLSGDTLESYYVDQVVELRGKIATLKTRLRQFSPANEQIRENEE